MSELPAMSEDGLSTEPEDEVARLVKRLQSARGPVMAAMQKIAGYAETKVMKQVPDGAEAAIAEVIKAALGLAFEAAATARASAWIPNLGDWGHRAVATVSGAVSGLLPIYGSFAELPFSISIIFGAILREAENAGFDPADEAVRLEAMRIFGDASPLPDDDATDMGFLALRITLATGALDAVLARAAVRVASVFGPKVIMGAVPLLGAAAGAGTNYAFVSYYQEVAAVQFRLLRLSQNHGVERVRAAQARAQLALISPS